MCLKYFTFSLKNKWQMSSMRSLTPTLFNSALGSTYYNTRERQRELKANHFSCCVQNITRFLSRLSLKNSINPRRPVSHGRTCKTRPRAFRSLGERNCWLPMLIGPDQRSRGNRRGWWRCLVASRLVDATCDSRKSRRDAAPARVHDSPLYSLVLNPFFFLSQ